MDIFYELLNSKTKTKTQTQTLKPEKTKLRITYYGMREMGRSANLSFLDNNKYIDLNPV